MQKITPFFRFDDKAEEAVSFYTSVFKNSKVMIITRYGEEGAEASGRPPGTVMTMQIVPTVLGELLNDTDPAKSRRVMKALLGMKKIDLETLKRASGLASDLRTHPPTQMVDSSK